MTLQPHKYTILQLLLNPIAVVLQLVLKLKLVLNSRYNCISTSTAPYNNPTTTKKPYNYH